MAEGGSFSSNYEEIADEVREKCRALNTVYDREAVAIICSVGIFALEDPAIIAEAAARCDPGNGERRKKIMALEKRVVTAPEQDERDAVFFELEALMTRTAPSSTIPRISLESRSDVVSDQGRCICRPGVRDAAHLC